MNQYKLYLLIDPESREIRYVGITKRSLGRRLLGHLSDASRYQRHSCHWIKSLVRRGLTPEITLLQSFNTEQDVMEAEIYWISYFRSVGCQLVNSNSGGYGNLNPNEETRQKISAARKGVLRGPHSAETKNKIGEANRRRIWSEESKQKVSAANKGRVHPSKSASTRLKLSQANKGKKKPHQEKSIICTTNGIIFKSISMAAEALDLFASGISMVLAGRLKTTGGYTFQYYNEAAA